MNQDSVMFIPPYDSVEYLVWSSGVTGGSLRFLINENDSFQIDQLRRLLASSALIADPYRLDSGRLFDEIAALIARHRLIVVADPTKDSFLTQNMMNWLVEDGDSSRLAWIKQNGWANTVERANRTSGYKYKRYDEKPEQEEQQEKVLATKAPEQAPEKIEIGIQVVDDATGDPLANVELVVTLPDGATQTVKTGSSGLAKLASIKAGGFSLSSPWENRTHKQIAQFVCDGDEPSPNAEPSADPSWIAGIQCIADVVEYSAQPGDGLNTIAMEYGLDEEAVALFNWETEDLAMANDRLEDAGAGFRDDDGSAIFTEGDEASVLIPGPWRLGGLHTGSGGLRTHTIRVKPVLTEPAQVYLFSF